MYCIHHQFSFISPILGKQSGVLKRRWNCSSIFFFFFSFASKEFIVWMNPFDKLTRQYDRVIGFVGELIERCRYWRLMEMVCLPGRNWHRDGNMPSGLQISHAALCGYCRPLGMPERGCLAHKPPPMDAVVWTDRIWAWGVKSKGVHPKGPTFVRPVFMATLKALTTFSLNHLQARNLISSPSSPPKPFW